MEDQNFDEKYASKLRTMIISNDREMVNLAKEIFEELKVEIIDFSPTVKLAREKLILGADKLLPYNFILTINTSNQFADEGLTNAKDILGKIRCDKLYLTTPVMIIGDDVSDEEEGIMENDSEVRFMNKERYRSSLGTDFVNLIKNSYPEGPKSLKTALKTMLNISMFLNCFRYPKHSQNLPQNHPTFIKHRIKKETRFSTSFLKENRIIVS